MLGIQEVLRLLHDGIESLSDDRLHSCSVVVSFNRWLSLLDLQSLVLFQKFEREVFQLYLVQVVHITQIIVNY